MSRKMWAAAIHNHSVYIGSVEVKETARQYKVLEPWADLSPGIKVALDYKTTIRKSENRQLYATEEEAADALINRLKLKKDRAHDKYVEAEQALDMVIGELT